MESKTKNDRFLQPQANSTLSQKVDSPPLLQNSIPLKTIQNYSKQQKVPNQLVLNSLRGSAKNMHQCRNQKMA
jgi:hypothetical protein